MLRAERLTRQVIVPVAAGSLADSRAHFAALTAYREGDPEPIVEWLSNATFTAVNNGRDLVAELHVIRDGWNGQVRARSDAAACRVADLLIPKPVVDPPWPGGNSRSAGRPHSGRSTSLSKLGS